jgi:hypothetical protein
MRLRYLKSNKRQKTLILDEFCEVCEISRKHAIKLLHEVVRGTPPRRGPKVTYGPNIHEHIVKLWHAMSRMCSKKMKAAIPLWLEYYFGITPEEDRQLRKISSSSIDRILHKRGSKASFDPTIVGREWKIVGAEYSLRRGASAEVLDLMAWQLDGLDGSGSSEVYWQGCDRPNGLIGKCNIAPWKQVV